MTLFPGDQIWYRVTKFDPRAVGLYRRHYSAKKNRKGVRDWLAHGITGPGASITLLTSDCSALFVWVKQNYSDIEQYGVNCAVFRNEGNILSSLLILEAEKIAWQKWPNERLFTFVDPNEINSSNPGYCFKLAGWKLIRDNNNNPIKTPRGLLLLEKEFDNA